MTALSDAVLTCRSLADLITTEADCGADLRRQSITVSMPGFRIMYVPDDPQAIVAARMELNERRP